MQRKITPNNYGCNQGFFYRGDVTVMTSVCELMGRDLERRGCGLMEVVSHHCLEHGGKTATHLRQGGVMVEIFKRSFPE
jgi:hypothetical protein